MTPTIDPRDVARICERRIEDSVVALSDWCKAQGMEANEAADAIATALIERAADLLRRRKGGRHAVVALAMAALDEAERMQAPAKREDAA